MWSDRVLCVQQCLGFRHVFSAWVYGLRFRVGSVLLLFLQTLQFSAFCILMLTGHSSHNHALPASTWNACSYHREPARYPRFRYLDPLAIAAQFQSHTLNPEFCRSGVRYAGLSLRRCAAVPAPQNIRNCNGMRPPNLDVSATTSQSHSFH